MPSAQPGLRSAAEGLTVRAIAAIGEIGAAAWDPLFGPDNPFLRHAFLAALEDSGSVGEDTGWTPCHLLIERDGVAVGALPLYRKDHSYGEFVFDWAWAQAYERNGMAYYPKLLTAVPFTPSAGPRLGCARGEDLAGVAATAVQGARELALATGCSGWHLLFPDAALHGSLENLARDHALLNRSDVQFHWRGGGLRDFDEFLATLRASRRKSIRRERRSVAREGVTLERLDGPDIGHEEWSGFYRCYVETYLRHSGHGGYLNRAFFDRLRKTLPECLMLVVARFDGDIIASALFLRDKSALYGRYWGCLKEIKFLHFETCFYQGIEYCIERGLSRFDPGTQGEHKLLRGFEPVTTHSWHWIADPRFHAAIGDYLARERAAVRAYGEQAREYLPFRRDEVTG